MRIEDETDRVDQTIIRRSNDELVCRGLAETRKVFELYSGSRKRPRA